MFPWLWIWSPRFDYPLSGNVNQDIATDWFFSAIKPHAGEAALEQKIFQHASYGKQLGLLTEAVVALLASDQSQTVCDNDAVSRLRQLQVEIEAIKQSHQAANDAEQVDQVLEIIDRLKRDNPNALVRLRDSLLIEQEQV